jgi:LytS/YehU family sensor histidine kinase
MQFFNGQFQNPDAPPFIYAAVFPLVGFFFISSTGWFVTDWFRSRKREVELVNSQLDSELKFLKLQLNPHFLFNTLNNIYSLAYFNDKNTPEAILKLSNMMRHMIYDSQDKFISLTKEVEFIDNFIELQQLKVDNGPDIRFTKNGIREGQKIAPLLFLAFLENSFKHGKQGTVDIGLSVEKNRLHFRISNLLPANPTTQLEKSGVGLMNVKKRLELIYPNRHELIMNSDDTTFTVELNVILS